MTSDELIRGARRTELELLCHRYAVRRLRLFDSAVRGEFDLQRSDLADAFDQYRRWLQASARA